MISPKALLLTSGALARYLGVEKSIQHNFLFIRVFSNIFKLKTQYLQEKNKKFFFEFSNQDQEKSIIEKISKRKFFKKHIFLLLNTLAFFQKKVYAKRTRFNRVTYKSMKGCSLMLATVPFCPVL